jgi:hypothetical protein
MSSGIDTVIKCAHDSEATALASSVFPVPGGPYLRKYYNYLPYQVGSYNIL